MTATPQLLADGFVFAEGPRWRGDRLWFSDMHGESVRTVDLHGRLETVAELPGREPSGLGFLPDGTLLVVSMLEPEILRVDGQDVTVDANLMFLILAIANLDMILGADNDVMGFARMMNRDRSVQRLASEYFQTNIFVGVSPFSPRQIPTHAASGMDAMGELLGITGEQRSLPGFHIGVDACMFGVDYPHFESNYERVPEEVADLVGAPGVTEDDVHKVLFENAAKVYGFDLGALQPDIDRVGFETGDLLATASA